MAYPEHIVHQDELIERVINANHGNAVSALLERYRIASNKDTFVAALIARLCLREAQIGGVKGATCI